MHARLLEFSLEFHNSTLFHFQILSLSLPKLPEDKSFTQSQATFLFSNFSQHASVFQLHPEL